MSLPTIFIVNNKIPIAPAIKINPRTLLKLLNHATTASNIIVNQIKSRVESYKKLL